MWLHEAKHVTPDCIVFSDAPYIVWGVSIYQDVCLFVCVSGHLLFTGLSRIGLNNQEYFSLDNQELI